MAQQSAGSNSDMMAYFTDTDAWIHMEGMVAALQAQAADMEDPLQAGQLRSMLPPGVDVDAYNWTAQHYAAAAGFKSLVQQLLDSGSAVDCKGRSGRTPLLCAAKYGRVEIVELLINRGADVGAMDMMDGSTPLHHAAFNGHPAVTELFLAKGADVAAVDYFGGTPLHNASLNGKPAVTELLLANGAAAAAEDSEGLTPVHVAVSSGHLVVTQLLLAKGAAVAAMDKMGSTLLHRAALNGNPAVAELLLANGAPIAAVDCEGWTPLHEAASNANLAVVELLLANGAPVAAVNRESRTALHIAARNGRSPAAQLLLANGAVVNAVDTTSCTPLHLAAYNGKAEVVELLLCKGAIVNAHNAGGYTPLLCALMVSMFGGVDADELNQRLKVINLLLQAGHPWAPATLAAAAAKAVQRAAGPNWPAFAALSKALFLADRRAFVELVAQLDVQAEDHHAMVSALQAFMEGWCRDMTSLDQQRAELAEHRCDIKEHRSAIQHVIFNAACLMKHVADTVRPGDSEPTEGNSGGGGGEAAREAGARQ